MSGLLWCEEGSCFWWAGGEGAGVILVGGGIDVAGLSRHFRS